MDEGADFVEIDEPVEKDDARDDLVVELQDMYFEGRYRASIEMATQIVGKYPKEEDAYDILLASHLALQQYDDVIRCSAQWVSVCGESLKQLLFCLEAAHMLGNMDLVEDTAYKLCFLFESSSHDHVFATGALLAASLCCDFELPIPDCIQLDDLLKGELLQEPLAWWLSCKTGRRYSFEEEKSDEQARDFYRCLRALEDGRDAILELAQTAAVDSTGLVARHLLCGEPLSKNTMLTRVHPLFRKRLAEKNEETK
jgi:hypothetical protein